MAVLAETGMLTVTGWLWEWAVPSGLQIGAGAVLFPGTIRFSQEHGLSETNYRGRLVPTAGGVLLWLLLLLWYLYGLCVVPPSWPNTDRWMLAVTMVGFAGLLDDVLGEREVKGLHNHWKAWIEQRRITTGFIKAGTTLVAGMLILLPEVETLRSGTGTTLTADSRTLWYLPFKLLLILLATNAVNLLDVRPGRALKGFFVSVLLLVWLASWKESGTEADWNVWRLLVPLTIGAGMFAGADLRGKAMLGDTGANMLGFVLGVGFSLLTPVSVQAAALALLAGLHAITWRRSLSVIIERYALLRWLDQAGRGRS
ncbi:hypothetical protein NLX71_04370 [Paenibacillus sp. MZ04-78.2]|uniref:hypothetical protein n=1 Tax=Paenibacillus sp. MZ04-78.2 TaxID=2962034 RepID=UPI0020B8EE2A|nr:hypothetical protein [Paenibacillus sp. MZ04-78.2]MCP3772553.1 hypothetical protein [Paenibacillus sp. MZ04-78.2]